MSVNNALVMAQARCYFCDGIVDESDGGVCGCGAPAHYKCLDRKGLVKQTSGGLLSSGSTKAKCPNCGEVHNI